MTSHVLGLGKIIIQAVKKLFTKKPKTYNWAFGETEDMTKDDLVLAVLLLSEHAQDVADKVAYFAGFNPDKALAALELDALSYQAKAIAKDINA